MINNRAVVIGGRTITSSATGTCTTSTTARMTYADLDNTVLYYKYRVTAPAKLSGTALVVQDPIDRY